MPLNKSTIPFQFQAGLETRKDSKGVLAPSVITLENALFNHPGGFDKRHGLTEISNLIEESDQEIKTGDALSAFRDQLIAFDGNKAYSKVSYQDDWLDKGSVHCAINSSFSVTKNAAEQYDANMASLNGLNCYVYADSRGSIRYTIIDQASKNNVVSDQLLSSVGDQPMVFALQTNAHVVIPLGGSAIPDQFVIIWRQSEMLQIARIYFNAAHVAPTVETITSILNIQDFPVFDACISRRMIAPFNPSTHQYASPVLSEIIYVAVAIQQNQASPPAYVSEVPLVFGITSGDIQPVTALRKALIGLPTIHNHPKLITICPINDISSWNETVLGAPSCIVGWIDSNDVFKVASVVTASVSYMVPSEVVNSIINTSISNVTKISMVWNGKPYNPGDGQVTLNVFFEQKTLDYVGTMVTACLLDIVLAAGVSSNGGISKSNATCKQLTIYSRPFIHNDRCFIVCSHDSPLQSTYFLMDEDLHVVSKINENSGGGERGSATKNMQPSDIVCDGVEFGNPLFAVGAFVGDFQILNPISSGTWQFASLKTGKFISQGNTSFTLSGVESSQLDFQSPYTFISAELNDNLYIVGGIVQNYDGNKITESGFNLYPETLTLSIGGFYAAVGEYGTNGGTAQINIVRLPDACRIRPGDYFVLSAVQPWQNYQIVYSVDGSIGTFNHASGYVPIQVNIQPYLTAAEVMIKTIAVINTIGYFVAIVDPLDATLIQITNTETGISQGITSSTIASYTIGLGSVAASPTNSYEYVACWKWIDSKGYIHRSTTSIPLVQANIPEGSSVTISVPILDLTTKEDVILEVYRTENLGNIPHLVTSQTVPNYVIKDSNIIRQNIYVIDDIADADILANEVIYTLGNVLDNQPPPACNFIAAFKDRLFVAGLDNKNLIQYSKISTPENHDFAVGFNDGLFIELNSQGGAIQALAVMDEKLIIFKETQIYLLVGDGPSNTGDNATFIAPELISSDTGCSSPNSIQITPSGLMFKSPKGIYILGRDLQLSYIGAPVAKFNHLNVVSTALMNTTSEVRFYTSDGPCLVFDYLIQQWSSFTNYECSDAILFNKIQYLIRSNGQIFAEDSNSFIDTTLDGYTSYVSLKIETSNLSLANLEGFQRVYRLQILGELFGPHMLRIEAAYDFSPVYSSQAVFDASSVLSTAYGSPAGSLYGAQNTIYGGVFNPYLIEVHLRQQKCTSIRFRISDEQDPNNLTTTAGLSLSSFALQVGQKTGLEKLPSGKRLGSS